MRGSSSSRNNVDCGSCIYLVRWIWYLGCGSCTDRSWRLSTDQALKSSELPCRFRIIDTSSTKQYRHDQDTQKSTDNAICRNDWAWFCVHGWNVDSTLCSHLVRDGGQHLA